MLRTFVLYIAALCQICEYKMMKQQDTVNGSPIVENPRILFKTCFLRLILEICEKTKDFNKIRTNRTGQLHQIYSTHTILIAKETLNKRKIEYIDIAYLS